MSRRAFTLIELLIVVAIIAILAAIAVPNFLEAQTRSKVSRVKADMRTVHTALEAYRVDSNTYPYGAAGNNTGGQLPPFNARHGFLLLIRPINYIAAMPLDPFGDVEISGGGKRQPLYEMGAGKVGSGTAGRDWPTALSQGGYPVDIFMMESYGPDKFDDTGEPASPVAFGRITGPGGSGTGEFPRRRGSPSAWEGTHAQSNPDAILGVVYDPTNGTVSSGQIFRTGGNAGNTDTLNTFLAATKR